MTHLPTSDSVRAELVFVLESTVLAGGIKVVLELANRLDARGYHVAIFSLGKNPSWFENHVPLYTFENYDLLGRALASISAAKVATLWRTAPL